MDPIIAPIAENGSLQQILELLKKGSYISQIIRTTSLPKHFVNKIVKWLKDKKVIIPIPGKPIFYKYDPQSAIDILASKAPPKMKPLRGRGIPIADFGSPIAEFWIISTDPRIVEKGELYIPDYSNNFAIEAFC